jgi:hypothetical protein
MYDVLCMMCDGPGCWRLDVAGWMLEAGSGKWELGACRLEEVTEFASLIHINSPALFRFHVSYFKNTSGMNSVDSLRKMFDRTTGCIKRVMGGIG